MPKGWLQLTDYTQSLCALWSVILAIRGSAVSVENPRNSYFWQIMNIFANEQQWVRNIRDSLVFNIHQSCMYGSKFDKWTSIRATDGLYNDIRKECDGNHTHESWRPSIKHSKAHFPTTKQAEYPKELCYEMSRCLAKFLVSHGSTLPDTKSDSRYTVDGTPPSSSWSKTSSTFSGRVLADFRSTYCRAISTFQTVESSSTNYGKRGCCFA